MIHRLFQNNFFIQFQAPNFQDLLNKLEKESYINNDAFIWGHACSVDKISLSWKDYVDLLTPSLEIFFEQLETNFPLEIFDPWMSVYSQGDYQEVHDHWDNDISCVLFLNQGENFSKFYFKDRHNVEFSQRWRDVMFIPDYWYPDIKEGDIIFFPSHFLHGVSTHRSSVVRKTFACNFKIKPE
jgi:hypothetical protein